MCLQIIAIPGADFVFVPRVTRDNSGHEFFDCVVSSNRHYRLVRLQPKSRRILYSIVLHKKILHGLLAVVERHHFVFVQLRYCLLV